MSKRPLLTDVELHVLADVARGLSNAQIAAKHWRSPETIRSHLKNILRKLKAANRTHAVAIAYHIGIFCGRSPSIVEHDAAPPARPAVFSPLTRPSDTATRPSPQPRR
ncbi:hypothetical protein GCM10022222_84400 [Amycolatopsis ultiminotia]|uniref:HTH luxR-type domain-containing protein n=1 Tax=Amycolatopsis ultiminotia TaxID=543629 RepID=A0ABP6YP89_9PSEU